MLRAMSLVDQRGDFEAEAKASAPSAPSAGDPALRAGIVAAIALATPIVVATEVLFRALLPDVFQEMRAELEPTFTPVAWVLAALTVLAVPLAIWLQRRMYRAARSKLDLATGSRPSARALASARFEAFFVATSIPQLPAVFAALATFVGAQPLPAYGAVTVSMLAVLLLAWGVKA